MLRQMLGRAAMWGAKTTGNGILNSGLVAGGFAAGAGMGAVGMAAGVGYLGYRAIRGYGRAHGPGNMQLNAGIQARMIGATLGAGAAVGMYRRDPQYRAEMSPSGNLEMRSPAMLDATGDLTLSLNRNARGIQAPNQYGFMTNSNYSSTGR